MNLLNSNTKEFHEIEILDKKNVDQFDVNSILQLDQFPDSLQTFSFEQTKMVIEYLYKTSNFSLINKNGTLGGFTALHWMCIKNEYDLMEFLITKCMADVNCKAKMGETPLLICIRNCNYLTIELLIKHGADMDVRDVYDRSIVHWIAYTGKVVIMYYFQKYHAIKNLNDVDKFLQNPLHIACSSGFSELIKYLIDSKQIDLFAQDSNGNTCMHLAAQHGLPRSCWLISQQMNGQAAKMIGVLNNKGQRPIDMIKDEDEAHFVKIREWLNLEAKTNKYILNEKYFDKKPSEYYKSRSLVVGICSKLYEFIYWLFLWNSKQKMYFEVLTKGLSFPFLFTFPIILQNFLFEENELTLWRSFICYTGLFLSFYVMFKQKHRIDHVSSLKNTFHVGFFLTLLLNSYPILYSHLAYPFDTSSYLHWLAIFITVVNTYELYKLMTINSETTKSIKKPDGSVYELHDLMKINLRENIKYAKDSFNWLIQPGHIQGYTRSKPTPQAFFCESCLIVQALPTKHCKLCNKCYPKFDHHCIYINRCVGVKNHKNFVIFLITAIVAVWGFTYGTVQYLIKENQKLKLENMHKENIDEQYSLLYLCFASRFLVRLTVVAVLDLFTGIMVVALFVGQIKSISLGYTKFFVPPDRFTHINLNMRSIHGAMWFRLKNLYIFLFKSCETNEKIYFNYQKDHYTSLFSKRATSKDSIFPAEKKFQIQSA